MCSIMRPPDGLLICVPMARAFTGRCSLLSHRTGSVFWRFVATLLRRELRAFMHIICVTFVCATGVAILTMLPLSWEDFLERHGYYNVRISRVDICLDFVRFDFGDDPCRVRPEIFQASVCENQSGPYMFTRRGHMERPRLEQSFVGLKTSSVTTKLYDKTMELYDVKLDAYKSHIFAKAWFKCGLIDDIQRCTKNGESVRVWRVEFSLTSSQKNWIKNICLDGKDDKPQSLKNTLSVYDSREKILVMFASLARHYFRFKSTRKERKEEGQMRRQSLIQFRGV